MSVQVNAERLLQQIAKSLFDSDQPVSFSSNKKLLKEIFEATVCSIADDDLELKCHLEENSRFYRKQLLRFLNTDLDFKKLNRDVKFSGKSFSFNFFSDAMKIKKHRMPDCPDQQTDIYSAYLSEMISNTSMSASRLGEILKQCRNSEEERTDRPDWLIDVEKLCSVASGSTEPIALHKTMLYFQSHVTDDVLKRITSLDVLKSEITKFLLWCHMKLSHFQELSLLKPCFEDLLAAIVSVYVDVIVLASRSSSTEERLIEGKHLCSTVVFLFSKKPEYILDVLIQTNAVETTDEELVGPLCRKCLLYPYKMNCDTYIKYVAVTRRCRKLWPNSSINDIETAVLSTPEGFLDWIKEKNGMLHSKFPISKHFKKKKILKFLLDEATEDFIDELLNIITDEVEEDEVDVKETDVHEENMDFSFVIDNRPDPNVANTFSDMLSREVEKKDLDVLDIEENLFGDVIENVEDQVEGHSHEMMEIEEIEENIIKKRSVDTKKSPTKIEKEIIDSSFVSGTESAEDSTKKKKKRKNKAENDDSEVKNLESDFDKEKEQSFEVKLGEELQTSSKKKNEKNQRKMDTSVELLEFSELGRGNETAECSKEENCLSMTGDELVTGDEECSGDLKGSKKKKRRENTKLVNNESQSIVKDETPQKSLCNPSIDGEHEEMKDCGSLAVPEQTLQDVSTDSSKKKAKRQRRKSEVNGVDAISSKIIDETRENRMKNNEESVINVENTDLVCDSSILNESPRKRKSKHLDKSVDLADGAIDHKIISSTDMSDTGSENVNSAGKKLRKMRNSETISSCHEIEIVQDKEQIKNKKVNVSDDVITTPMKKILDEIIDGKNSKSSPRVKRERKMSKPAEAMAGNDVEIVVIDSDSTQDEVEVERSDENRNGNNAEDCGSSRQCKSAEKVKTNSNTVEVSSHSVVDSKLSNSTPSKTKAADAVIEKPNSAANEPNKPKNKSRKKVVEESAIMVMEEFTEFEEVQDMEHGNDELSEAVDTSILHNSEKKKKEKRRTISNSSNLDADPVIGLGVAENILDSGSEKKHGKKRNSENAGSCRTADEKFNKDTAVENVLAGDDNVNESLHHDVDQMDNDLDVISPSPNKQKVKSKLFCSDEESSSLNVSKKAECSKQFTALKSPSSHPAVPDDQSIKSASKTKSRRKSGAKLIALSLGGYFMKEYGSGQGRPKIYKSGCDKPKKYGSGQRRPRIFKLGQEEPTKCASCQERSRKCQSDQEMSAHIKLECSEISDYKVVVKQENPFVPELHKNISETSPSVIPTELHKNISETSPPSVTPTELHNNISETSPSVIPTELHKNISETSPPSVVSTELHKNISETSPPSVVSTELHKNISETSPSSVVPTELHKNIYKTSPSSVVPEKKSSNVRLLCCGRSELTSSRDKLPLSNRIKFSNVSLIKCCKPVTTIYKMSPAGHVDELTHCGRTLKSESSYYRRSSLFSTGVPVSPTKEQENENICVIESSSTESDKFSTVPDISRFLKCDKENQKSSSKVSKKPDTKTKADDIYSFENLDLELSNQAGKSRSRPDHVTRSRTRSETISSERPPTKTLSSDGSGFLPSLISPPSSLHTPQELKKQNLSSDGLDDVLSVISVQTPTKLVRTPVKETGSSVKVTTPAKAGKTPTKLRASTSKVVSSAAKSSSSTLLSSADKSDDSSATERRRSTRIMEKAKNENHHSSQCCPDTPPLSTGKKRKLSFFTESAKKRYELRMHSNVENPFKVTAEDHSMEDELD